MIKHVFWVLACVLAMAAIIIAIILYDQSLIEECLQAFPQYTYAQCRVLVIR